MEKKQDKDDNDEPSMIDKVKQMFSSDTDSDTGSLTKEQVDSYLEKADLLGDDKQITKEDTSTAFSKVAKGKNTVDFSGLKQMLHDIADSKKLDFKELHEKLKSVVPGLSEVKDWFSGVLGKE